MKRFTHDARKGWQDKVEALGLTFHTYPEGAYWEETSHYELTQDQVNELTLATDELYALCTSAVNKVITENLFGRFGIPEIFWPMIKNSWKRKDLDLFGRFDLSWDGKTAPKMLEFNADCPGGILEAGLIQKEWLKEFSPGAKQFNSIEERMLTSWEMIKDEYLGTDQNMYFAFWMRSAEDQAMVKYIRALAEKAGMNTPDIDVRDLGWNNVYFTDLQEKQIDVLFKLYPWNWMIFEEFGENLTKETMEIVEPAWKLLLSNKALLPLLWEMYPDHPNLLAAYASSDPLKEAPYNGSYVAKPRMGFQGENIRIYKEGKPLLSTEGETPAEPADLIYQEFCPLTNFDGNYPVVGSWVIGGRAAGIGILETEDLITDNSCSFVPHLVKG